jgi:hypothetical protein
VGVSFGKSCFENRGASVCVTARSGVILSVREGGGRRVIGEGAYYRSRRLHHVWSSANLASKLSSIEVLKEARGWERPSDHVPVIARFDLE